MAESDNNVLMIKTVQIAPFRTLMIALKDILLETNISFQKDGIRIINMDKFFSSDGTSDGKAVSFNINGNGKTYNVNGTQVEDLYIQFTGTYTDKNSSKVDLGGGMRPYNSTYRGQDHSYNAFRKKDAKGRVPVENFLIRYPSKYNNIFDF